MIKRRIVVLLLAGLMILNPFTIVMADQEVGVAKEYIKWGTVRGNECEDLSSIAYGRGRFVTVGSGGIIRVSEDGAKWRKINWNGSEDLHKIIYNGSFFVAVGGKVILRSVDGLVWQKVLELKDEVEYGRKFDNVAWNGESLYAFGLDRLYSSKDGIQWEKTYEVPISQISSGNFSGIFIDSIAFSKDKAVAIAIERNFRIIMSAEDESPWLKQNAPNIRYTSQPFIYYTGQYFIVQGLDKTVYSENGVKWSFREKQTSFTPRWVKNIDGKFYGSDNMGLYTSEDGFSWKETGLANSSEALRDIAQDEKGRQVVVGDSALILLCGLDGKWVQVDLGLDYPTNGTATDGTILAAVGDHGQILITKDGERWDKIKAITDKNLRCIAFGEKRFVAAGEEGEILVSADGYKWHKAENSKKADIGAVAYGAGRFVAVGEKGFITVSEDGEKWREVDLTPMLGKSSRVYETMAAEIVFNGKFFLVISESSTLRSLDGITWEALNVFAIGAYDMTGTSHGLYEMGDLMVWDGKRVLIATHDGIMQTENGEKWFYLSEGRVKDLHYASGIYIWGNSISSDACTWVTGGAGYDADSIRTVAGFKGKIYAFAEKGVIHKGQILSLPETADANAVWAYAFSLAPIRLEAGIPVYKDEILYLPIEVVNSLIEGQCTVDSKNGFILSKNGTSMVFSPKSNTVHIDGSAIKLPAECFLSGKKLMIPADFVFDQLGFKLEYYPKAQIINVSYKYGDKQPLIEWEKCVLPKGIFTIYSMACNGESYALLASTEKGCSIATSEDGVNWTKAADIEGKGYGGIFTVGKRFVLAYVVNSRDKLTGVLNSKISSYISDDGLNWNVQEDSSLPLFQHYPASDGSTALILGKDGYLYRTVDGTIWEKNDKMGGLKGAQYIKWENDEFIINDHGYIWHSPDGMEWSHIEEVSTQYGPNEQIKSSGRLGAAIFAGSSTSVYTKKDNSGWEKAFSLPNTSPAIIGQINGRMVAYIKVRGTIIGGDSIMIYSSADGKRWDKISELRMYVSEDRGIDTLATFTEGRKLFIVDNNELLVGHMK